MLIPLKSNKNRTSASLQARLQELEAEAEAAMDAGDPRRAVELLQAALQLAPLDRHLRAAVGDALLALAEQTPRKRSSSRSRVVETLDEAELDDEGEIIDSSTRRRSPIPAHRAGMAATDKAEEYEQERESSRRGGRRSLGGLFGAEDNEEAEPIRRAIPRRPVAAAVPLDDRKAELSPRPRAKPRVTVEGTSVRPSVRGRRPRGRFLLAAAMYAGLSLVVLGAAQGMISHVLRSNADLPEIPRVEMLPEELTTALNLATEALAEADPQRAIALLAAVESNHPSHSQLLNGAMARAWRSAGNRELDRRDYAKAAEAFETATRLDPLNADNWIELGRSFREHGRSVQAADRAESERLLGRARDSYRRALDVSPNDPAAIVGLAQTFSFLGQRNNAVAEYERVIRLHPDSPESTLARQHLSQLTGRS